MLCQGVALVRQHIDGVARASSAGTKSGSSVRSLVLLTMLVPVSRCARWSMEYQLGLDGESNSEKSPTWRCHRQPPSAWHLRRRFAPTSSVSALQLILG